MKKIVKIICILISLLLFCSGCWDKVELDDWNYVLTIGIDQYDPVRDEDAIYFSDSDPRLAVTFSAPVISGSLKGGESKENSDSETSGSPFLKKTAGNSMAECLKAADSIGGKRTFFGHSKVVLLGKSLLSDNALLKEVLDYLERNQEISLKMIVLAVEDPSGILNRTDMDASSLGLVLSDFYKNNEQVLATAFRKDLDTLVSDLRKDGNTIIPLLKYEKNEIHLSGAAIIKDFSYVGQVDDKDIRGFLWQHDKSRGDIINAEYEGQHISLAVKHNRSDIQFKNQDGKLICSINVYVAGNIEEYTFGGQDLLNDERLLALEQVFEQVVENEVIACNTLFQQDFLIDGFDYLGLMKKQDYQLWQFCQPNWKNYFQAMTFDVTADVSINGIGVIR